MADLLANLNSLPGALLLALIAYCDTLIGVGFFVLGEIAFLAAGAAFAATGHIWPALLVLVSAWAGDLTSYWIGRRAGIRFSLRFLKPMRRRRAWRRGRSALVRRGMAFVILSRLLGPTAWVTPFLAGTMGLSPVAFACASAIGVLIGVGQFILIGAAGMQLLPAVLPFLMAHGWPLALGLAIAGTGGGLWLRARRTRRNLTDL